MERSLRSCESWLVPCTRRLAHGMGRHYDEGRDACWLPRPRGNEERRWLHGTALPQRLRLVTRAELPLTPLMASQHALRVSLKAKVMLARYTDTSSCSWSCTTESIYVTQAPIFLRLRSVRGIGISTVASEP